MLRAFREFLQWRKGDAIILAEANVLPKTDMEYFGDDGDRMHMMFNFQVNQNLFYALASADTPPAGQGAERNQAAAGHRAMGHVPAQSRRARSRPADQDAAAGGLRRRSGPTRTMQLYDRGIRRRLAPMLDGDRRRIELAYSLMFTLPGTPVMRYGDELGMGDDLQPARAQLRAHADAMVDRAARRLHPERQADACPSSMTALTATSTSTPPTSGATPIRC